MLSLAGSLTLHDLFEQAWKQVHGQVLEVLQRTVEGLLLAERDRSVQQARAEGQKVYRWGYTVRKSWQTLWGELRQVRAPRRGSARPSGRARIETRRCRCRRHRRLCRANEPGPLAVPRCSWPLDQDLRLRFGLAPRFHLPSLCPRGPHPGLCTFEAIQKFVLTTDTARGNSPYIICPVGLRVVPSVRDSYFGVFFIYRESTG